MNTRTERNANIQSGRHIIKANTHHENGPSNNSTQVADARRARPVNEISAEPFHSETKHKSVRTHPPGPRMHILGEQDDSSKQWCVSESVKV